jgi:CheY-like chemotaxis protein
MSGGSGQKRQLGKILLKQKLVTPDELQELLDRQRAEPGKRLASAALDSGRLREVDLLKALSEQHGLPGIDLAQVVVPLANLKLIPEEIARQHLILPILVKDDRIYLAMADPQDRRVIDEIEFVTGRRVFSYVAIHDSLVRVIKLAYDQAERGEAYYVGPDVPADYLRSLGLEAGILEPTPGQRQVVVDEAIDELGIEELGGDIGAMADSQVSRVRDGAPRTQRVVLVVDDEDDIRRLLKRALTDAGYAVVEAARGIEALERVRAEVPDVILLDAMLPEVHGFDICRRIKGSKRYGHIPVIMVSAVYRGWRFAEDLKESYGVDAFQGTRDESVSDGDLSREASEALERGIEAYQAGDLEKAIGELQRGVGIDPLSFKLHYHLGLLYGRRDDLFEGIHELETAVDLQPRNFSALKNLAVLYQRAGFKHKAIEMWERALASAPDDDTRKGIKEHLMTLL